MNEKTPSSSDPTEHLLERTIKMPPTEEVFDITQEIPREAIEAVQRQEILKEIEVKTHAYKFLNFAQATRTGVEKGKGVIPHKKDKNDDSGIIGNNYLAVADGVGGLSGGDIASQYLVSLFEDEFKDRTFEGGLKYHSSEEAVPSELDKRRELGKAFLSKAQLLTRQTLDEKGFGSGSGTTFTGAIIEPLTTLRKTKFGDPFIMETTQENGEIFGTLMHVGDSHAYIQRKDGSLELITSDEDGLYEVLRLRLGNVSDKNALRTMRRELQRELDGATKAEQIRVLTEKYDFSRKEAEDSTRFSNVIYGIGSEIDEDPHVTFFQLSPGDRLVIISDGLDTLTDAEKAEILRNSPDSETASRELIIQAALKAQRNNTKEDDMTVAILQNNYAPIEEIVESV